jgi:hypothetical protein
VLQVIRTLDDECLACRWSVLVAWADQFDRGDQARSALVEKHLNLNDIRLGIIDLDGRRRCGGDQVARGVPAAAGGKPFSRSVATSISIVLPRCTLGMA